MQEVWGWLLVNPARPMVLASLFVTWRICAMAYSDRNAGESRLLKVVRVISGVVFTLATALVAGLHGGIGTLFGYLLLQLLITVVIPIVWIENVK